MTTILKDAIEQFGVDVHEHLDRDLAIPVVNTIGRQGDVLILARTGARQKHAVKPIPAAGFPAVRGENGGNTHLLLGECFYDPEEPSPTKLDLGVLTVPDGAVCYLAHPEHAYLQIDPGNYTLRRQREQADELRLVAD